MVKVVATYQDGHSEERIEGCKCKLPSMVNEFGRQPNIVSIYITEL